VVIGVYAVFALAATARALFQLATKFSDAPIAYSLSAFAALVYVAITVLLWRGTTTSLRLARNFIVVELVGVIIVGAWSLLDPAAFPRATVWSHFGEGYGFIPLILPIVGLFYLRRTKGSGGKDPDAS
jgi:hypothetical protein